MAASRGGPRAPKTVCGRRHCNVCGHWRPLIDFGPRRWADEDKTVVKYVQSECHHCRRVAQHERYDSYSDRDRKRRNQTSRAWHRRNRRQQGRPEHGPRVKTDAKSGSVDRLPFARWLKEKIELHGIQRVARTTGMAERHVRSIVNGYDRAGKAMGAKKKTKLRPIDHVQITTVDEALLRYGEPPSKLDELYPVTSEDKSAPIAA